MKENEETDSRAGRRQRYTKGNRESRQRQAEETGRSDRERRQETERGDRRQRQKETDRGDRGRKRKGSKHLMNKGAANAETNIIINMLGKQLLAGSSCLLGLEETEKKERHRRRRREETDTKRQRKETDKETEKADIGDRDRRPRRQCRGFNATGAAYLCIV